MNNRRTNITGLLLVLFMGVLVFGAMLSACDGVEIPQNSQCDVEYRYSPTTNVELKAAINKEIALFGNEADLKYINVSGMEDMRNAFANNTTFNGDISCWNTSGVVGMESMFENASAFNQDIGGWNTSQVTSMVNLFSGASAFNNGESESIGGWDTGEVTGMVSIFQNATSFNQDIVDWNIEKVTSMSLMFQNAISFNQDLSGWDVSGVIFKTDFATGAHAGFTGEKLPDPSWR